MYSNIVCMFFLPNGNVHADELDALNNAKNRFESALKQSAASPNLPLHDVLFRAKNKLISLESNFKNQIKACRESKIETDTSCAEGNNKGWNQFSSMMGSFTDIGSMAMSATCSKLANALKMGQAALLGFRGVCSYSKSGCVEKCELAEATFKKMKKTYEDVGVELRDSASSLKTSTATTNKTCGVPYVNEYLRKNPNSDLTKEDILAECILNNSRDASSTESNKATIDEALKTFDSIGPVLEVHVDADSPSSLKRACIATQQEVMSKVTMNLGTLMMSLQKNQACAKELASFDTGLDLSDCNITGTCTPTTVPDECLDPKNKDAIYCKTSTLTGTNTRGGGGGLGNTKPAAPDFSLNPKNFSDLDMNGLGGGGDANGGAGNIGDTPGPRSAGVPGGGGGGGLSIPGGSATPPRGGGGGRGVSSDGSGAASPSYAGTGGMGGGSGGKNEDLQQYLPGGAKDPSLAKLGGPEGITAAGGPTIFEKVTKGYKNNRSTLIPE